MAKLKEKIGTVLAGKYRGAAIELKFTRPGNRIVGALVWNGFQGQEQIDRQIALRNAIRKALSSEDLSKVSFIMTLTPSEKKWMSEKNGSHSKPKKSRSK